jgi:hypothetical protein
MIDDMQTALTEYRQQWEAYTDQLLDQDFWKGCRMTAIGWKVEDETEFNDKLLALRDISDQVHLGWVNERWIATFHLRESRFEEDIRIVKLMQRRPGSIDAIGLDHADFLLPNGVDAKAVVSADEPVEWSEETNGEHCKWISIWFAGTEAKLRSDTTLEVCIKEMQAANAAVMGQ